MLYTPTPAELRGIQLTELDILIEIDRICRKHNIGYSLNGGTMLGAVRHKGFIPWDDDIDVFFLRPEYEKFRKVLKNELGNEFYFQDMQHTPGYRWGYGKLRMKNTLFVRENQEDMPYEQGIFVDLFVGDFIPNSLAGRAVYSSVGFAFRKALWAEIGKRTAVGFEKFVYEKLSLLPVESVKYDYCRFIKTFCAKKTDWVREMTFPMRNKDFGFPAKWMEQGKEYEFEGHKFFGYANTEGYLWLKFGDYMKLPPESERKVHPISKLKLPERYENLEI
ncbi:MAG: LicD family protein [Ruminococcus sp.]|jgi:lipopolysaccharide cholinephosphotransferase|nr:LicD family protein [Ruminococcus sp.]